MKVFVAICFAMGVSVSANAQSLTGSLSGTVSAVRNDIGAAMPGAFVVLTSARGDVTTVTEANGTYRFPALEPGRYTISVSSSGLQPVSGPGLVVTPGRNLVVDFRLQASGTPDASAGGDDTAVDVQSSRTEIGISPTLLESLPVTRDSSALLNYLPGINNGSAYGGAVETANALFLDGVDIRDPANGVQRPSYNVQAAEGFHVQGLGAPASSGGYTGTAIHTITKSGGNRPSAFVDLFGTNDGLNSRNIPAGFSTVNPTLADPSKIAKSVDWSGQFGGPIRHDRLFSFASAERMVLDTNPAGPVTKRRNATTRLAANVTFQPDADNGLSGLVQYESNGITGRVPEEYPLAATDFLTSREDGRHRLWLGRWRHTFNSSTVTEVSYSGWVGYTDENPEVAKPGHIDERGLHSVSQGTYTYANRNRHHVVATYSRFFERVGRHAFLAGAEFERSATRDRYGYVNNLLFEDLGGRPYLAYSYSYDLSARNTRETFFAQDSWALGHRLTANVGVRGDAIQGAPERTDPSDTLYRTVSWAPRLGVAWDVGRDHRTVLRGSYGWYYEGAQTALFLRAVPGVSDRVTYVVGTNFVPGPEIDRERTPPYRVASNIKHPRVDEATLGFERVLNNGLRLSVTGVWREWRNVVGSVAPLARWSPVTTLNGLTGQGVTLYRWINRSTSEQTYVIQNVKGFEYKDANGRVIGTADPTRTYGALLVVVNKRLRDRLEGQVSYVLSTTTGTADTVNDPQLGGREFETPNLALINADGAVGSDRRHEFKLLGRYVIPRIDVSVGSILRVASGRPYTPFQRFPNLLLNTIGLPDDYREPLLERRGNRHLGREAGLDLRLEKRFVLRGRDRLGCYVDITNATNASGVTSVVTQYPRADVLTPRGSVSVPFATPETVVPPRQVWAGARWSF